MHIERRVESLRGESQRLRSVEEVVIVVEVVVVEPGHRRLVVSWKLLYSGRRGSRSFQRSRYTMLVTVLSAVVDLEN